ncbi:MAG: PEGA domain-containing protein [Deltaproteobacteria bacterium]|nr:PEGA domain-containing protein [Deltaproteobacteria bacterium]
METVHKSLRGLVSSVLFIAAISVPSMGLTQGDNLTDAERQTAARENYQRGKELYDKGDFTQALDSFQAAYDIKPHPVVLKSVAECKVMLGDIPGAIETLELFLSSPEATKKEPIKKRLEELKGMLTTVEVTSEPPGAGITVDGKETDKFTPATIELGPGEHEVSLKNEEYEPVVKKVTLESGVASAVSVDFATEGIAIVAEKELVDPFSSEEGKEDTAEEEDDSSGPPAAFWVCAALTGVGLVSGTVFGVMALGDEEDYKDSPTDAKKEAGEREAIIADVSFGVAAAAAIVGTIVLLTYDKDEEEAGDDDSSAKFKITPVAGGETLGLNASFTF